MPAAFDPGALLGASYSLAGGTCVFLRMARPSDAPAAARLLRDQGRESPDLQARRLAHFDPRESCVLCATALLDGRETLLGIGAVTLDGSDVLRLGALVVDAEFGEDLAELLRGALIGRATALTRSRAA